MEGLIGNAMYFSCRDLYAGISGFASLLDDAYRILEG